MVSQLVSWPQIWHLNQALIVGTYSIQSFHCYWTQWTRWPWKFKHLSRAISLDHCLIFLTEASKISPSLFMKPEISKWSALQAFFKFVFTLNESLFNTVVGSRGMGVCVCSTMVPLSPSDCRSVANVLGDKMRAFRIWMATNLNCLFSLDTKDGCYKDLPCCALNLSEVAAQKHIISGLWRLLVIVWIPFYIIGTQTFLSNGATTLPCSLQGFCRRKKGMKVPVMPTSHWSTLATSSLG